MHRAGPLFAIAFGIAAAAIGCGHGTGATIGLSDPSRTAHAPHASEGVSAAPGDRPVASPLPNYRATFVHVTPARTASRGHAPGRFRVEIYANEKGAKAYEATRGDAPVGAALIEEHYETVGDQEALGPVMAMEKVDAPANDPAHGWRYTVVGSRGDLVQTGPIESCTGCHRDAPNDGIFRLP